MINLGCFRPCFGLIIPVEFTCYVNQSTGVDDIIHRVDDAAVMEYLAVPLILKLVVGATGNHLARQARDRLVIDYSTHRAGSKDRAGHIIDSLWFHDFYLQAIPGFFSHLWLDI